MSESYYKYAKVPCCRNCKGDRFRYTPVSTLLAAGLLLFSVAALYFMIMGPIEYGVVCLVISWVFLMGVLKIAKPDSQSSVPIAVSYQDGRFRYEVWEGPLYEYLSSNVVQADPERPSNTLFIPNSKKDDDWDI